MSWSVLGACRSGHQSALDLDRDVDARGEIELFQLVNRLGRGFDNIDQPFVGALLESLLGLFVRMRRALHGEALNSGREGDRTSDAGAGAFDGIRNIAGGLVYDAMVISLETNTNALSSHTKNNCLLMVLKSFRFPELRETEGGI